jgi:hypothetical protein
MIDSRGQRDVFFLMALINYCATGAAVLGICIAILDPMAARPAWLVSIASPELLTRYKGCVCNSQTFQLDHGVYIIDPHCDRMCTGSMAGLHHIAFCECGKLYRLIYLADGLVCWLIWLCLNFEAQRNP